MSHRFTTRLASAALCGFAMVGGSIIPAHADLAPTPQTVFPYAGNVNTTNVSVCGKPGRYDGDGYHEGQKAHVSVPVQVSPSVISSVRDSDVKDAVIAVPTLLDHVSITVESVVGYKYDQNDEGENVNPQPVVHKMNLRMPTGEKKTRVVDEKTGLSGMVKTTAKAAGFDDGAHNTDKEYNVYDVSTFATVPEIGDDDNVEYLDNKAAVVNYRVEGEISPHNLDKYDSVPVAVKAGAWRSGKDSESPRSTVDSKENDLSQFEWGRVSRLPDWTDQAEMSQVARNVVPGAGVDWGGISANKDGDESHILGDVNPTRSWAKKYAQEFALWKDRANLHLVSGFDGKDDGFDMGLISVHDCDASPSPTPEASASTSSPSPSATSADPSAPNTESATPTTPATASASSNGASSASATPTTTAAIPTMNGSPAAKTSVSSFPAISAVPSRNTTGTPSNDADSDRDASSVNLPATGALGQ